MDLRMSVIGNLETSKQLLEENPEIKIIALAACLEKTIPEKLLQAGFYGYLSKNTTTKELVLVIKSVYAGKRYFTSWIAQNLARKVVHGYLPSTEKLPVQ
jgi:two-component system invasion response regulator UvrY